MDSSYHNVDNSSNTPILVEIIILLIVGLIALIVYPIKYIINKIKKLI